MGDVLAFLNYLWAAVQDPEHNQGLWLLVTAASGSATALILFAAALVATRQLREARVLREAQVRPFIVIDFHVLPNSAVYLRISNLGTVMARDIRFSFDRPFVTKLDQLKIQELQIFKKGIESIPPGQAIETFFDMFFGRDEKDDLFRATVEYRGEGGRKFTDQMDLDLGLYRNTSPIHSKTLDDVHKELETLAKTLTDFKARGGDGLLVLSPEDVVRRDEQFWAAVEKRRAQQSAAAAKQEKSTEGPSATPQDGTTSEPETS
jgi:hypothetical protein